MPISNVISVGFGFMRACTHSLPTAAAAGLKPQTKSHAVVLALSVRFVGSAKLTGRSNERSNATGENGRAMQSLPVWFVGAAWTKITFCKS